MGRNYAAANTQMNFMYYFKKLTNPLPIKCLVELVILDTKFTENRHKN